jgi:hypothetical protein
MGNINLNTNECVSGIPVDIQLQICREAARAFVYLCEMVCEKFGQEGVKVIEENFLSDSDLFSGDTQPIEGTPSREVSMTLIKLLASWGIKRSSCVE